MSFKTFVYYCALCGAWAAFLVGLLVLLINLPNYIESGLLLTGLIAALLGVGLGIGIGTIDALLNSVGRQQRLTRVGVCTGIGLVGGFISGVIGYLFIIPLGSFGSLKFIGWTLVGVTIGAAVGAFDVLQALKAKQGTKQAMRKLINGLIGGTVGGLIGGLLYDFLDLTGLKGRFNRTSLSLGLIILGGCIGLLIGLAQVILKEAWLKVEAGFRPGRELILSKPETTIGRAEGNDIGLFGDTGVEKMHARILLKNNRYLLEDVGTPSGTLLNGERVDGPTPLRNGDAIQVGKSVLRFSERQKRQ